MVGAAAAVSLPLLLLALLLHSPPTSASASAAAAATEAASELAMPRLLQLDGDAPWIVPPELFRPSEAMSDHHSDTAQTLALRDVELDWYKVTGYRAAIIGNATWNPALQLRPTQPAVFFGDAARHAWLEPTFNLTTRGCGLARGEEAHCVLLTAASFGTRWVTSPAVVAVGNGTRGAVYAAFAFSEHVLGVSPWYRFSLISQTGRTYTFSGAGSASLAPPKFRHRAIFLNDEELLGFFRCDLRASRSLIQPRST